MSARDDLLDFEEARQKALDNAASVIAHAFEDWGQAWWTDDSGDVLARVAAEALHERNLLVPLTQRKPAKKARRVS